MTAFENSRSTSCLGRILVLLSFIGMNILAFGAQLLAWSGPLLGIDVPIPAYTLVQIVLTGVPLVFLAWLWPAPRERAMFRTWLLAVAYVFFLLPARFFPPTGSQAVLLTQLGLSLIYLILVLILVKPGFSKGLAKTQGLLALAVAAVFALPWLVGGGLGSPLDTLLSLALGLVVGLIVGLFLAGGWLPGLVLDSRGRGWDIFTGGLVMGAALMLVGSGLSFNGLQLLLMLALPGLGWIGVALSYGAGIGQEQTYSWRPLALLVGVVVASILALVDTDVVSIVAQDQALLIAFKSAAASLLIGCGLAILALLARSWWGRRVRPILAAAPAAGLWLVGLLVYLVVGQPGFYGDRVFVILQDQADVSPAAQIEDYDQRRHYVYDTLVEHARHSQAGLRQSLDRFGLDYQSYYLVNAVEVEGGLLTGLLLLTRPEVERTIPSPVMRPLPVAPNISSGDQARPDRVQWNLTNIGADRVWEELGVQGEGIVIGQSDSGVELDHPELQSSYRGRDSGHDYNWLDPWTGTQAPVDHGGHGTHTLGSVLGQSMGVAPGAEWFACANLQRNLGNPALYLDCMQFMLAPYPLGGDPFVDGDPVRSAHVLNNSWGCPEDHEGCDPESLLPAVQALRAAGIFVVASAGNDGPGCSTVKDPLPIYDEVFSVGAVDEDNNLASFSSVGPVTVDGSQRTKPDILAPGVAVLSAYPGSSYFTAGGTSMAGPHVAGVVALMWSANPELIGNIERTEKILIETARPFTGTIGGFSPQAVGDEQAESMTEQGSPGVLIDLVEGSCLSQTDVSVVPNNIAGYGVVDAYQAVKRALAE